MLTISAGSILYPVYFGHIGNNSKLFYVVAFRYIQYSAINCTLCFQIMQYSTILLLKFVFIAQLSVLSVSFQICIKDLTYNNI